jgi:hypothetical protein
MIVRLLLAFALLFPVWSRSANAACDITDVAPTGTLPTMPPGQTFSFIASDGCGTVHFSVPDGSGFFKVATRGAAAGMHAHAYRVSLTASEWRSVTGPAVTNFVWTVAAPAPGGGDSVTTINALDSDHDGWTRAQGDAACDRDPARNPGIPEDCSNGIDDDCDGASGCVIPLDEADVAVRGRAEDGGLDTIMVTGDLDADGTADLLLANGGFGVNEGEVYVAYGPSSGASSVDDLVTISATVTNGRFGSAIAAGDGDGDGMDDALIGAPKSDRAYLFLGPITAGLDTGDAFATLFGTLMADTGFAVAVVPDFDGDGSPDFAVGASRGVYVATGLSPGTNDLDGAAYLYEGRSRSEGVDTIGNLGDVDGDGIADLAIAMSLTNANIVGLVEGGSPEGTYVVQHEAFAMLRGSRPGAFGENALTSLDYDGDGTTDVLVGAYSDETSSGVESGVVYGFLGPLSGDVVADDAPVRWESSRQGALLGYAIAAGDCDADGQPDILVGAPFAASQAGAAFVQRGFATGVIDASTLWSFRGSGTSGRVGASVALIPDWTGNGASEIAIGAPDEADSSGDRNGAVYVVTDPF